MSNERRKAIANLDRRLPKLEFAVTPIFVAHAGAIVAECARGELLFTARNMWWILPRFILERRFFPTR